MISTDPPYYDNIVYADLSDYFYVWLRFSLRETYPELFQTLLVPKNDELVASPYRFSGNSEAAKNFFRKGMFKACEQIYKYADTSVPVTIYYAYKQNDRNSIKSTNIERNNSISTGWETMLSAIIKSNFIITGTWPIVTEKPGRSVEIGANALTSSIVLVCRKRPEDAPQTTKKNFINALRREMGAALKKLQESNIAPVDLAQAAIGPGMAVFSRYRRVLEADGTSMTVRSALQSINEQVDAYFNERVGTMDAESRFCIDLYTQCAYNNIKYGEAEVLATAKTASIPAMASRGMLYAKGGDVHLIEREDIPKKVLADEYNVWMLTQELTQAMKTDGVDGCARIVASMFSPSNAENAKDLAYRLYTIAERKNWSEEARHYNSLVVAWPDIQTRASELHQNTPEQGTLFDIDE